MVTVLVAACGYGKKSGPASQAAKWRSGSGKDAGNFPLRMEQACSHPCEPPAGQEELIACRDRPSLCALVRVSTQSECW